MDYFFLSESNLKRLLDLQVDFVQALLDILSRYSLYLLSPRLAAKTAGSILAIFLRMVSSGYTNSIPFCFQSITKKIHTTYQWKTALVTVLKQISLFHRARSISVRPRRRKICPPQLLPRLEILRPPLRAPLGPGLFHRQPLQPGGLIAIGGPRESNQVWAPAGGRGELLPTWVITY